MKKETLGNKRPYTPPSVKQINPEQAKKFVAEHADCTDREATAILELMKQGVQKRQETQPDFLRRKTG
jgi:hypothetical protein